MIVAEHLTKSYGSKKAVDDISFTVEPGRVTGFLGPNGAGKSTTMRMIVGLDTPTRGTVTVKGASYASLKSPLTTVGALLDAKAVHTGRSARNHLRALAATHGIPVKRADEVIEITGLTSVASKRAGGFSLGMGQRLGIAAALLGDPEILILDEPVNGLDPEGVLWVRNLVRGQAAEGRTVFLSSHLMSEMSMTADHLIVLGKGKILADAPTTQIVSSWTKQSVSVTSPDAERLASLLASSTVTVTRTGERSLTIDGTTAEHIGSTAFANQVELHQLAPQTGSLEDAYLALTGDSVEYKSKGAQA